MGDWRGMLDELLDDDSDTMTAWEVEFVESLNGQRKRDDFEPSDRQWETLERIWGKVFG